ncbi:MAG: glycosyltransferase family 4 protein [Patescibacteria group bacterium]
MGARIRKPRILMFLMYPLWGSGSGVYARELAQSLARKGYEIAIACPDRRRVPGVRIFHVDLPFMAAFTSHPEHPHAKRYSELRADQINEMYQAFLRGFTRAVETFEPDVIHAHHAAHTAWIANYCRAVYRINYLVTVHGTDVYNATLDRRFVVPTIDALNHADMISVVSGQTRKWMFRVYGKDFTSKVRTITGGVDSRAFPAHGPAHRVERQYGLRGKKVVLFTGKLIPTKGVTYLIRAARQMQAEVFVLGDGPERKRLMQQASRNPHVHFPGYVKGEALAEFYRRADVMVVPSVWDEPLGLITLEAMSSGTPVVASKRGGIGSVVKHGQNGFLVRARSGAAIARAVNKLLADGQLRTRMSTEARRLVEERFDWRLIADSFVNHYQGAASQTRRRHAHKQAPHLSAKDSERGKHELDIAKKTYGVPSK